MITVPDFIMEPEPSKKRETWGGTIDFILSCLGFAVGIGNVWRFPYLCGRNGGGAFMLPYLVMMIFAGLPIFYMELGLGQFAALTPHVLYRRMVPVFSGIGYTMVMASVWSSIYYNMIIAWALRYLFASFQSDLPFVGCHHEWNSIRCIDYNVRDSCASNEYYFAGACRNHSYTYILDNGTELDSDGIERFLNQTQTTSGQEFNEYVLGYDDDKLATLGAPKWDMVLSLAASWVIVFFCLIKGVHSSGKVVYFTATFPYVILCVLFVLAMTLDGMADGLHFFLTPRVESLINPIIWKDAANQIFFSLSLGGGGLATLASYNQFHNNIFRDTLIVVLGNCFTSLFAGFVIFPIIGYVAKITHRSVENVAASGTTLAFVVYPAALAQLKPNWLWAILFFFMLVLLGIDSQLVYLEVFMTAITDQWPILRRTKYRIAVLAGSSCIFLLIGLLFTIPEGKYFVTLFDAYGGGLPLVIACCIEIMMVSWVYGLRRFIGDIYLMLGEPPNSFYRFLRYPVNWYWKCSWFAITPILLLAIIIASFITLERTKEGDYVFPVAVEILGVLVLLSCIIWIPVVAIWRIVRRTSWQALIRSSPKWRPSDTARKEVKEAYSKSKF